MNVFKNIEFKKIIVAAIIGYCIALICISLLIFSVANPNPVWGKNWFVKPLVITPIVGAIGGISFYIINCISFKNEALKFARIVISILVFLFYLWIGTILGLDGTLWN